MSETDSDDQTPLINPVSQSNSHGTFRPTAPVQEEDAGNLEVKQPDFFLKILMLFPICIIGIEPLHEQQQRFNPFDRQANAIFPSAEVIQDSVSFWTRVRRYILAHAMRVLIRLIYSIPNTSLIAL